MTDLKRHFDSAVAFFLAGERSALDLTFGNYKSHSLSAPTIVSYALSVELGLKLLYSLTVNKPIKGHDLTKLLKALPSRVSDRLPTLLEHGQDISHYFKDWRYPFERDFLVGDIHLPRTAFIECCMEIKRIRPGLVSFYETSHGCFIPDSFPSGTEGSSWVACEASQ